MNKRIFLRGLVASAVMAVSVGAFAQPYPSRPISVTVPFSAGGPTDTIARIMAERMGKSLGQPVIVENVAGAGGTIGVSKVLHAKPDGYSIIIGHVGTNVIAPAVQNVKENYLTELEPIAMIATNPQVLVVKKDLPVTDLKSFIAAAKAKPDAISAGTGGPGTPSHISGVAFGNAIKSPLTIVHYKGSGPALQDVVAGHIDATFDQALNALPQIRAGRVKALAVTSKTRLASAPDIPTTDEAGLPGFYMSIWHALWVPKGTPKEVVAKLNAAAKEALADPVVRKKLADLGQEIPSVDQQTPDALRTWHKAEVDKWVPVIKAANITAL